MSGTKPAATSTWSRPTNTTVPVTTAHTNTGENYTTLIIGVGVGLGTGLLLTLIIAATLGCLLVKSKCKQKQSRQPSVVQYSNSGTVIISDQEDERNPLSSSGDHVTGYEPYTSLIPSTRDQSTHYENLRRGRTRRFEATYETIPTISPLPTGSPISHTYEHIDSPRLFTFTNANSSAPTYTPLVTPIAEGWEELSIQKHEGGSEGNDGATPIAEGWEELSIQKHEGSLEGATPIADGWEELSIQKHEGSLEGATPIADGWEELSIHKHEGSLEWNDAYFESKNVAVPGQKRKTT